MMMMMMMNQRRDQQQTKVVSLLDVLITMLIVLSVSRSVDAFLSTTPPYPAPRVIGPLSPRVVGVLASKRGRPTAWTFSHKNKVVTTSLPLFPSSETEKSVEKKHFLPWPRKDRHFATRTRHPFLPTRILSRRSSSPSSSSLSSLVGEDDEFRKDRFCFDIGTASTLVGGQSLLIVVGLVFAWILKTPNAGFGGNIDFGTVAFQQGCLYTIPLLLLAVVLDWVEDYVPALQDVSAATQRSVLLLLGGTFRPIIGLVTALLLGIAAGVGEELLFRGIFQWELAQRLTSILPAVAAGASSSSNIVAIVLSSIIFGALHGVTKWYAILATLASLYFGYMYVATQNLAVPMICHALYDIGALLYAHWTVSRLSPLEQQKVADWEQQKG